MLRADDQALELPGVERALHDGVPVHPAGPVDAFGVYVHFPYCTQRCPYCDFAVHVRRSIPHARYAEAVIRELDDRATLFPDRIASTLYFGGGTPGLWEPTSLGRVLAFVRARYRLVDDAEITVEINPGEIDHLHALRAIGVNRLSIGAQSFDDRSLGVLGRTHDGDAARAAVHEARRAGFANVSVDLMVGLPRQGRQALDRELEALLSLDVEHVSVYGLTIEKRTAFSALQRDGALELPDVERQAELYERARDRLAQAGYVHHEISSWARPGRHARHNTLYWTQAEYLGVGSSASSLRIVDGRGQRFANHRSVDRWFSSGDRVHLDDPRVATLETLDEDALEREALWLGLRLVAGIDRAQHARRFGHDPLTPVLQALERAGLVIVDDRIRLSPRGVLLADEVGARLV